MKQKVLLLLALMLSSTMVWGQVDIVLDEAQELASDAEAVAVGKLSDAIAVYQDDGNAEALKAAIDQFKSDNADQEFDQTSKVATNGWKKYDGTSAGVCATQFAPAITTYDGRNANLAEVYEQTVETTGTIIYQDITGLRNGTYKVGFYGNAFFTSGRGFESEMEDGAEDVAYVFANEDQEFITAKIATETTENNYRQFDVEVTDESIRLGMGKAKAGTNWHTMQIHQLTWFTTAKEAYKSLKEDMKADIASASKLAAAENMTQGKEDLKAAISEAKSALNSTRLNIPEFEDAIKALSTAVENFSIANRFCTEGSYYICDPNSGLFIAAGHDYGTRGIVNEYGLDLTFIKGDNNTVTIDTKVANGADIHFLGDNLYMDSPAYNWIVMPATDGYTIANQSGLFLSIDENNNLIMSSEPFEWLFKSPEDLKAERINNLANATEENPVDVTWMIQAPNFNRNDQRISAWTAFEGGTGLNLSGGEDANRCAENYHTILDLEQTIEDATAGLYTLSLQGFYRQDKPEGEEGEFTEDAPIISVIVTSTDGAQVQVPLLTGSENSMSDASNAFTEGNYTIDPVSFIVKEGDVVDIHVISYGSYQWLCFDNFKLFHNGPAPIIPTNLDFADSEPEPIGVRTYAKDIKGGENSGMQEVDSWTIASESGDSRAASVFAYNSYSYLGSEGYLAPDVNMEGKYEGNALGIVSVWGATTQYTQEATLEAGKYVIAVPVFNAVGGTTAPTKSLFGFIDENSKEYFTTAKAYPVNQWSIETVSFDLDAKVNGNLSLGYQMGSGGSGVAPHLFVDQIIIKTFETDEERTAYIEGLPLVAAKATLFNNASLASKIHRDNPNVGTGLFQTPEEAGEKLASAVSTARAVAAAEDATLESIAEAQAALDQAIAKYKATVNKPEEGTPYDITNTKATGNLSIADGAVTLQADAVVYFTSVEGGFVLMNASGEYIFKTTENNWTLKTTTDIAQAYVVTVNIVEGGYTIKGAKGLLGTDSTAEGSAIYADKSASSNSIWTITESAPIPVGINSAAQGKTMADGKYMQNGKVVIIRNGVKYNVAGLRTK